MQLRTKTPRPAVATPPRSLAGNTLANLLGQVIPLVVALFVLPVLTRQLGSDRFGVLTLTWVVLGYFNLFDLGLGRAMTKVVAEKIGLGEEAVIPAVVWTSLGLMLALGLVGAVIAVAIAPWLIGDVLNIPPALQRESLQSFYLLATSIPIVTSTAGLRGVLEAKQRFDLLNLLRVPLGSFSFLGPLLVLPFSHSLVLIVAVLLAGRIIGWIAHLLLCLRVVPALRHPGRLQRGSIGPLLSFGGWTSVSNIIGPLMVSLDRFVIGTVLSVSAVAYYAAPYEVVTKLWIIPAALTGVLFPAFAASWAPNTERAVRLLSRSVKYTFLALFPITLCLVILGHEILGWWLGSEYAQHSTRVLQWLAIGVFLNCLAQIPFALIQAAGRPDITAKLHVLELPFYLLGLWWLIRHAGIQGAAIAWTARCLIDTAAVFGIARGLTRPHGLPVRVFVLSTVLAVASSALGFLALSLASRALILLVLLVVFGTVAWLGAISPEEKSVWRAHVRLGR
jgi:O-antigen/teichoic acid export membrane protein